jgi:Carboxypeptidase regulatory-like domain
MCARQLVKIMLLGLICIVGADFSQSQSNSLSKDGTALTIQGTVLQKPQGQPVKKATVQLIGQAGQWQYSAVTDADGRFIVEGVKPGRYVMMVEHAGFIEAHPRQILNTFSQATTDIVLHLQPAAIIVGKITDADGDPMRDVSVMATRVGSGRAGYHEAGNGITNDLGEFRISGLRPGRYTVLANPSRRSPVLESNNGANAGSPLLYVATYYPGTLDKDNSVAIDVESGSETPVAFSVLTSRAYRVSGDVVGLPSSNLAQILLISDNGLDAEQQLEPGGKFNFPHLLPGTYRVQIMLASVLGDGMQPSMRVLGVNRPIEVNNEEISQLHLQVEQGSSVTGRFRMDNGQKFDWTQLNVMLVPSQQHTEIAVGDTLQRPNFSAVSKDGTFEIKNVPKARYSLIVLARESADAVRDYFTKSVILDGQDVSNSGFEATPGTALEVVISAKGATIEGTVVDDKGNPAPFVTVVDVPSPERRLRPDLYQQDTTDKLGHFSLRGLNPGSYTVFAFEDLRENVQAPEFLGSYGLRGEKVELGEGVDEKLVLHVILADFE